MYFGMRRSGWRTPVPSHKSFCFRTGDPGFTSRVDGWELSWGFFCSSAFGLVCAAAGDWWLELLPGRGVWLNAVDAKNQRKKAQCRVIDLPLSPNGEHAVGRSPETQAVTRDIGNCSFGPPCPARHCRQHPRNRVVGPRAKFGKPPAPAGAEPNFRVRRDATGALNGQPKTSVNAAPLPAGDLPATNQSQALPDRKSTRLNSSHRCISYAVFCLKKT